MTFKHFSVSILAVLLISTTINLFAEDQSGITNSDNLTVSLAFMGPADALYSWWGHVAVIIENNETGASRYYDYGNFSFDQDSFVRNFIMGRLYFLKMGSDPQRQLMYNAYLNRDVTVYTLDISYEQKIKLYEFLENDIKPENRIYLYDHFYDNCSTRIRDILDIVTDNEFSRTYDVSSDKTLRMQLRRTTFSHHFMDWLLNFAMNGSVDRPATELEGMFLPHELEKGVAKMIIHGRNGETHPFVSNINIYNRAEDRDEIKDFPPQRWPMGAAAGAVLAALAGLSLKNRTTSRVKHNLTALYSILLSFILVIPGTLLFFMACFTDHTFAYWNMNLFFINPFLFVTMAFSIRMLINKKLSMLAVSRCWSITAGCASISIILKIVPFFRQDNWDSLLIVMPAAFILGIIPLCKDINTKRKYRTTADSL